MSETQTIADAIRDVANLILIMGAGLLAFIGVIGLALCKNLERIADALEYRTKHEEEDEPK